MGTNAVILGLSCLDSRAVRLWKRFLSRARVLRRGLREFCEGELKLYSWEEGVKFFSSNL